MKELLQANQNERVQYFQEATARSENIKNAIIIEKDFWVCWVLEQIFSDPSLSPHIIFKGGTSLSKCYNIIERFSEDIDLTLSKPFIGITDANDPAFVTGRSQRDKRLDEFAKKVRIKIVNDIKPLLEKNFRRNISNYFDKDAWRLEIDEDDKDKQTLIFHYPSCFEKKSEGYIQSSIKLEFGARGDVSPSEFKIVSPYVQQLLPELFQFPTEIKVAALIAQRTFWEKITLLHAEYHRDINKSLPSRLFRHYYDIVMLDQKNITKDAMQSTVLLDDVVKNKTIYFPCNWANYNEAKIGSLHIYPNEKFVEALKQDCKKMAEMFFGDPPNFEKTMADVKRIENFVNSI